MYTLKYVSAYGTKRAGRFVQGRLLQGVHELWDHVPLQKLSRLSLADCILGDESKGRCPALGTRHRFGLV